MRLGSRKNKKIKKIAGNIRQSQLITTFGTGAIVDLPGYSVIIVTTNYWSGGRVIKEPNLQKLLRVKHFKEPKATETDSPLGAPDIPAFRFPMTHFCPKCKRLMSYKEFGDKDGTKCPECKRELIPSRFIAACINGHLEDFPYKWWVHYGKYSECPAAERYDQLRIDFSSKTGGLGSIKIKCIACNSERTMEGSMHKNALKGYKCHGRRPWIGLRKEHYDSDDCNAIMKTLQRGASNVYFSITQSALTIPPSINYLQDIIEDKWSTIENYLNNDLSTPMLNMFVDAIFIDEIKKGKFSTDDIVKEIIKKYNATEKKDKEYTKYELYEDEYKALCSTYDNDSEKNFKTVETKVPPVFEKYFSSIILVKRLREVLALRGFRRITPDKPEADDERAIGINNNDFVPLSDETLDWLPAIEMLGEGIFIRFNEEKVRDWEEGACSRYDAMKLNLGHNNISDDKFSARYVLLHTFSHLLIRQLTNQCGYSGAALKERIYSTYPESNFDMSGILIYTASSDSDGSLGGLVRQGETEEINNTILNLIQEASWCSSDPLCIESMQQGYNSLNYAACHACTLLPETSCEARNCLLDRVSVIGKMEDRSMGYFGELLE